MRVNVYAEEMPDNLEAAIQIHSKEIDGQVFTGLRIYLHMPVSTMLTNSGVFTENIRKDTEQWTEEEYKESIAQLKGPFIHKPGDDDSSAVTFWGKKDLREMLRLALAKLDAHYTQPRRT